MVEDGKNESSVPQNTGPESFRPFQIGRYEVIYPIGQGGMAAVYAGRLTKMAGFEKLVAIKLIHPHLSSEDEFIGMFLDEARLAAGIRHPNVAEIFEVDEDEGTYYMVGELVVGRCLRDFLERANELHLPISQPIAASIIAQVAHGLNAAHQLKDQDGRQIGLVHRDVSPRNILISYDGFVKLIDFGIAFASDRLVHTQNGALKGKLGFMPPEHIRGAPLDRRSDIFSLGVVLYLMVTGVHPFPGYTEAERMQRILKCAATPPSKVVPSVSPELDRIILKALAPRQADRYETAAQMALELERFARSLNDNVGPGELSVLMHSMFSEEVAAHDRRIRDHRKQQPLSTTPPSGSPLAHPASSGIAGHTPIESSVTPLPAGESPTRHSHLLARVLILCGAVLLAFGLGWLVFGQHGGVGDTSPSAPAAPAPKDESGTGGTPSPPARVTIELAIFPPDADVVLDGRRLPAGTRHIELVDDSSRHVLHVSSPGYAATTHTISDHHDGRIEIRLTPSVKFPRTRKMRGSDRHEETPDDRSGLSLKKSPYQ